MMGLSKVVNQHTELEHTPKKPLPTRRFHGDSGFLVGVAGGFGGFGCAISGCVVLFLEPWKAGWAPF